MQRFYKELPTGYEKHQIDTSKKFRPFIKKYIIVYAIILYFLISPTVKYWTEIMYFLLYLLVALALSLGWTLIHEIIHFIIIKVTCNLSMIPDYKLASRISKWDITMCLPGKYLRKDISILALVLPFIPAFIFCIIGLLIFNGAFRYIDLFLMFFITYQHSYDLYVSYEILISKKYSLVEFSRDEQHNVYIYEKKIEEEFLFTSPCTNNLH